MLVKQQEKEVKAPDSIFDIKNATIVKAMLKAQDILFRHEKVMVSISGGSDSDIMLDMIERCKRGGATDPLRVVRHGHRIPSNKRPSCVPGAEVQHHD